MQRCLQWTTLHESHRAYLNNIEVLLPNSRARHLLHGRHASRDASLALVACTALLLVVAKERPAVVLGRGRWLLLLLLLSIDHVHGRLLLLHDYHLLQQQ